MFYNNKIKHKILEHKYKEFSNQSSPYMEWGCGECNFLEGMGCFIL